MDVKLFRRLRKIEMQFCIIEYAYSNNTHKSLKCSALSFFLLKQIKIVCIPISFQTII